MAAIPDHEYLHSGGSTSEDQGTTHGSNAKPDFSRLCRICANSDEYLIPIFEGEGVQLELQPKLEKYLPVTINPVDELPTSVCYQCASSILSWHDLIQNCISADKQLRIMKEESAMEIETTNFSDATNEIKCDLSTYNDSSSNSCKETEDLPSEVQKPKFNASHSNMDNEDSVFSADANLSDLRSNAVTSEKFIKMLSEAGNEEAHQEGWNSVVVIIDETRPELCLKTIPTLQKIPVKQTIKVIPRKPVTRSSNIRIKVKESTNEQFIEKKPPDQKPFFDLGNGEWVCSLCYYFTGIKEQLINHQAREHSLLLKDNDEFLQEKAKAWYCNACDLQFSCNDTHRMHMKRQHPVAYEESEAMLKKLSPKYLCDLCEQVFYEKVTFRKHNTSQHLFTKRTVIDCLHKRSRRCELCGGIYDSPESLKDHLVEEHPKNIHHVSNRCVIYKNLVCTVCWVELRSTDTMIQHLQLEHNIADENVQNFYRLLCRHCTESFEAEKQLAEHHKIKHLQSRLPKITLKTERNDLDRSLICDLCGKAFTTRHNMLSHRERHVLPEHWTRHQAKLEECRVTINGETNFQCHLCPRVHEKSEDFIRHLVLHEQPKTCVCHECGFQTTRERLLKRHISTVHLKCRDYKCDFCPQAFGTKRTLDDHRRRHTGERPWVCKVCSKNFPNATCLYKHKQSHTDYFPFSCDWPGCDMKCRTRGKLESHMTVHTGVRRYACSICPKAFRRLGDLKKHETVHTDLRPCVCDICGRAYKHRKYLAFHKKTVHMKES